MSSDVTYEQLLAVFEAARKHSTNGDGEWEPPTPLVDWIEAYGQTDNPAQWLTEPLLPAASSVAMYAKGGTGKSLLALWLAAGLATGTTLTGPAEPLEVLYLDYEMTLSTVVERLEDMGYDDPHTLKRFHYASLPSLAPLDTIAGGQAVVDMAQHLGVKLVVIDTFGRAVSGDENEADTVRNWYRWTGQLLKVAGIAFLRIDHAGKDATKGQRGSSAKNDDVDVVWEMTARDGGWQMRATKRRFSWVEETITLTQTRDGILGYRWRDDGVTYWQGSKEVADILDSLNAPVDISRRKAMDLLRSAGDGRANNVVADALKYRRHRIDSELTFRTTTDSDLQSAGQERLPSVAGGVDTDQAPLTGASSEFGCDGIELDGGALGREASTDGRRITPDGVGHAIDTSAKPPTFPAKPVTDVQPPDDDPTNPQVVPAEYHGVPPGEPLGQVVGTTSVVPPAPGPDPDPLADF